MTYILHRSIVDWYSSSMVYRRLPEFYFKNYIDAYNAYQLYQGKKVKFCLSRTYYDCIITN